jgi:hypothetical protein
MSADETRAAVLDGLQKYLDAARADERVPLPWDGTTMPLNFYPDDIDGEALAAIITALGGEGWQVSTKPAGEPIGAWLEVAGRIAGLKVKVYARANEVCEPIEPQPVIERSCPALDAVIAEAQEGGSQ